MRKMKVVFVMNWKLNACYLTSCTHQSLLGTEFSRQNSRCWHFASSHVTVAHIVFTLMEFILCIRQCWLWILCLNISILLIKLFIVAMVTSHCVQVSPVMMVWMVTRVCDCETPLAPVQQKQPLQQTIYAKTLSVPSQYCTLTLSSLVGSSHSW